MHLIFRVHKLRYLWLNSVFVVTFTVTTFMGGVVTFMGVCDTYGKLLDTYGSFVIFMGVVTFMGRTTDNYNRFLDYRFFDFCFMFIFFLTFRLLDSFLSFDSF